MSDFQSVHVEQYDGEVFCEDGGRMLSYVTQGEWHENAETIQRATCPQCLLRVFMLGDSASIALKRMGMKVDVHDVDPELQAEN